MRSRDRGRQQPNWRRYPGGTLPHGTPRKVAEKASRHEIGDRALADGQTEHFGQQTDETLEADRLGDVKMDDQRAQSRPERRARLESFRRRRCDLPAAAGTDAAMAVDAGDGWADGRQLDVIIGMDLGLIGGAERIGAMRAGGQRCLNDAIGMFGQRAADAGATATALLQSPLATAARVSWSPSNL